MLVRSMHSLNISVNARLPFDTVISHTIMQGVSREELLNA